MKKRWFVNAGTLVISLAALVVLLGVLGSTASAVANRGVATPLEIITPTVTSVDPEFAFNDLEASVIITGTDFTAELSDTLVLTSPTAYLGSAALTHVTWANSTTLTATVPWGLDPGVYTLTVVNPDGGTGSITNAFTVTQGLGQWNSGNLFGGEVRQILLKPGDSNTVYALVYAVGLFLSRDAGETWSFITNKVYGNADFVIDPNHPSRLYSALAEGLFRSEDEGDTWTRILSQWPDGRWGGDGEVFVSPHDPNTLFFGSAYSPVNPFAQVEGLLRSTDDGAHWSIITDMEGISVRSLAFHPNNALEMVLGTSDGRVFRSTDGGDTWNPVVKPPIADIGLITYNPYIPAGEVWVGADDLIGATGLVKSATGVLTGWLNVAPNSWVTQYHIVFTGTDSVYVAANQGFHSVDGGVTWQAFGPPQNAIDLAFDPAQPDLMYAGDYRYGVQRSTDGGQNWVVTNNGIAGMVANWIGAPPGDLRRVYAGFNNWPGIFRSSDSSASWQFIPIENFGNLVGIRVDPADPQVLYLTADTGLFTSTDSGLTWNCSGRIFSGAHLDCGFGPPSVSPIAFDIDPFQPGDFLVGTRLATTSPYESVGAVYMSTDFGSTWSTITVSSGISVVRDLAFDPVHPGVVYLATGGSGAFRSQDHGQTWEPIQVQYGPMNGTYSIAIAAQPQPMVIIGGDAVSYRSLDSGNTWSQIGCLVGGSTDRFMFANQDSRRFYAATWFGSYLSVDGGQTCARASGSLGRLHTTALASSLSGNQAILYAGTTGGDLGAASRLAVYPAQAALAIGNNLVEAGIYRYVRRNWQTFLPLVRR